MFAQHMVAIWGWLGTSLLYAGSTSSEASILSPNSPAKRIISRGEVHTYTLSLPPDVCADLTIHQMDIDVTLSIVQPNGRPVNGMNASAWGRESWRVCSSASGIYELRIAVNPKDAVRGAYVVISKESSPAGRGDKRLRAQTAFLNGLQKMSETATPDAIPFLEEAASQWQQLNNSRSRTQALIRLGVAYHLTGNYQKAYDTLRIASSTALLIRDLYLQAESVRELALVTGVFRESKKALNLHRQALRLFQSVHDRRGEAASIESIGTTSGVLGNGVDAALPYYRRALRLWQACGCLGGISSIRERMGGIYLHQGKPERALEEFSSKLELARQIGDRRGEAAAITGAGQALVSLGRKNEGVVHLEAALQLRQAMGDYSATAAVHLQLAGTLSQLGRYPEAIAQIESGSRITDELRAAISVPSWSMGQSSASNDGRLLISVLMDWHKAARRDGHNVTAFLQADRMFGRHLVPNPSVSFASLDQIRQELLDEDTVLLRFWQQEVEGVAWVVTPELLESYALPGRRDLESMSRRLLHLLTARNRVIRNETVTARRARIRNSDDEFEKAARSLSTILFGGIQKHLSKKRLLIAADGALQFVPFAVLPDPRHSAFRPLVRDHELVSLPSALALLEARRHHAARGVPERLMAVVADPVFGPDDPRVLRARHSELGRPAPIDANALAQATRSVGLSKDLPRLPYSRREALDILEIVAGEPATSLLGFSATREAVLGDLFSRHRVVHLATHGFLNPDEPNLSGLVFSRIDAQGRSRRGFVQLRDIYNLKVAADLVVLSACRTARGEALVNQGVIGLTSGFMYAGAPRVVSTLWNVDDEATAELMKVFYAGLLSGKAGSAGAALRQAQLQVASHTRWNLPYYWAGFTLSGDWTWQTH